MLPVPLRVTFSRSGFNSNHRLVSYGVRSQQTSSMFFPQEPTKNCNDYFSALGSSLTKGSGRWWLQGWSQWNPFSITTHKSDISWVQTDGSPVFSRQKFTFLSGLSFRHTFFSLFFPCLSCFLFFSFFLFLFFSFLGLKMCPFGSSFPFLLLSIFPFFL